METKRSTTYRKTFFKNTHPAIANRYFCTYCGRLLKKKDVTVDHLYPINVAQKSRRLRRKLKRKGITDINDIQNLVPACKKCNSRKGKRMGIWILRGKLGRHKAYWIARYGIRLMAFAIIMIMLLQTLNNAEIIHF